MTAGSGSTSAKVAATSSLSRRGRSGSPLRVVYAAAVGHLAANGVSQVLHTQLNALAERDDIEVEHWDLSADHTVIEVTSTPHYRVYHLPRRSSQVARLASLPEVTRAFLQERAKSTDLIHTHWTFTPENLHLARLGVPYANTPHGGYDALAMRSRAAFKAIWYPLLERPMLNGAGFMHALTQVEADRLRELGVRVPILLQSNPVDVPAQVTPWEAREHWTYIGRLSVEPKGLDRLVRAYAQASRREAEAGVTLPPLRLVGPDFEGGAARLRALVQEEGLSDRVSVEGAVNSAERDALLARTRVFLYPSRWEGLPVAPLEALAAGCPVIVTPGTNLTGTVEAAGCGWVPQTDEALADSLLDAAGTTRERWNELSGAARTLIEQRYRAEVCAQNLAGAYWQAAGRS